MLSLREAAEETGLTKPALLKAIKKGRISAQKNDRGEWEIDPAELFRVYERKEPVSDESETVNGDHRKPVYDSNQPVITLLESQIRGLEADKEDLRTRLNAAEAERARLLSVIERQADQVKLLTDQRKPEPDTGDNSEASPPAGFLGRLRWLVTGRT
jgi:hypothetical protein